MGKRKRLTESEVKLRRLLRSWRRTIKKAEESSQEGRFVGIGLAHIAVSDYIGRTSQMKRLPTLDTYDQRVDRGAATVRSIDGLATLASILEESDFADQVRSMVDRYNLDENQLHADS